MNNNQAQKIINLPCATVLGHPSVLSLSSHFSFRVSDQSGYLPVANSRQVKAHDWAQEGKLTS